MVKSCGLCQPMMKFSPAQFIDLNNDFTDDIIIEEEMLSYMPSMDRLNLIMEFFFKLSIPPADSGYYIIPHS